MIIYANWGWLILFGIISFMTAIVDTITAAPPLLINLSFNWQNPEIILPDKALDENQKYSLFVELFNIIRAFHFIFWFFYSNSYIRQRKVTQMNKLIKWFGPLLGLYLCCIVIELYFGLTFVSAVVHYPDVVVLITYHGETVSDFKQSVFTYIFVNYSMVILFILICSLVYMKCMMEYKKSMVEFHSFLTNYRQTPRSRFLRKYQPQLEPLYEENSVFEKSVFSS